ncbi:hypothetical protein DB31_1358 [Hyalangium minutum]|uniref:DUF1521 domain-containing protein n=2 Tax=Hyalangium minutum TaxID=394096 RepID=A0A085WC29_9BACT|nr:hypothetical protein DB31_1358 [Hyalangium minutum]
MSFPMQTGLPAGANRGLTSAEAQMVRAASMQAQVNVNINLFMNVFQSMGTIGDICGPRPRPCFPQPPMPANRCHPQGSLKSDPSSGVVTTPGGYKIEQLKQHDWKITGPDGKETKIWGDPHVAEGDGGTWDFKRDSTFVLGDGTRINVTTKPYGNGMTVTGELDIISGNDRVKVTGIDQGKGNVGQVTHDGFQHVNDFGGKDVFVMGKETDDWSFQGKEIVGSNNGGESFKLGNDLPAGVKPHGYMPRFPFFGNPAFPGGVGAPMAGGQGILPGEPAPGMQGNPFVDQMRMMFQSLMQQFQSMMPFSDMLSQRNFGNDALNAPGLGGNWMNRRQQHLGSGFDSIGMMMGLFAQMSSMSHSVQSLRNGFIA